MKILFVCNTLYQIIGASCIRKMFPKAEAEIILSDHSTGNKRICEKFQETGLIFDKAHFVETKHLYDYDNSLSATERYNELRDNKVLKMVDLSSRYDMFFCANAEPFTERIANYIKSTNLRAELNWFEDGLSAYNYDKCSFPKIKGRLKSKFLEKTMKVYRLTSYIDNYYVFKPEKMEWFPNAEIKRIKPLSEDLVKELGVIFGISKCPDKYEEKYIFFEDGAQDWNKSVDIELVNKIAEKVGKENIFVRIHPRNPVNRFKKLGYKTNQDTSIPWEIIVANLDIKDKVLMTMYSQCVVTSDILMGVKGNVISLGNLDTDSQKKNQVIYSYIKRAYFNNDKEHYMIPNNIDQLMEIFDYL